MRRCFWAVTKPYGVRTLNTFERIDNGGGTRADRISAFATRAARDAYVSANSDNAEAVASNNKHLRRALRRYLPLAVCPCCQGEAQPTCAYCLGTDQRR